MSTSQAQVLDFVRHEIATRSCAPTYREIATKFGWKSPKAAADHVDRLARKGYLLVHRRRSRGIEVLDSQANRDETFVSVPIRGSIAAGRATGETEVPAGLVLVDKAMLGQASRSPLFAVRVAGDSMTGRGICDGDIAVAATAQRPHIGDVVVALIDQESTLKTLEHGSNGMFLKSANPRYPDLFPASQLVIQGVVCTIIRKL